METELFERKVVLAYLIERNLNTYTQVAATLQAYINDPETILTLIANDQLAKSLETLREMESVLIDIDPNKEEMVPRPDPTDETEATADWILEEARSGLLEEYRGREASGIASVLTTADSDGDADAGTDIDDDAGTAVGVGADPAESDRSEGSEATDVAADGGRDDEGGGDEREESEPTGEVAGEADGSNRGGSERHRGDEEAGE